jgi:hypothetical protein
MCLIRMRSQVQVLAGPPPIVAAHSAAGTEPGAPAAGLGRAGAAPPSPPAPPVAPPGPPTRPSGSATTTHRGRAPSPRTPATRRMPPPRAAACSRAHSPAAREGRSAHRPGCLIAQWSSAAAAARTQPGGPGPPPTSHWPTRLRQRRPRPGLLDRRSSRRRPGQPRASTRTCGHGRPATATWSPTPPPEGEETDASGRTGADTGRLDTGRVDSRRPTAGPCGRRPQVTGHRTAGQPDPGRQYPDGWTPHGWTPATDAVASLLAGSTTATTPDLSLPAGRSSGPTSSGRAPTRTAQRQGLRGHPRCYGWVWPPPRPSAAGGTPPSSWRLGALLSCVGFGWYERRAMGLRKGWVGAGSGW